MKILEILTKNRKTGNFGENAAVKHLKKNGYKILERNYVACGKEIDIIALRRDCIAFVEVKTRSECGSTLLEPRPASSVTPEKQRGIINCAKAYVATKHITDKLMRFDIIEVLYRGDGECRTVASLSHLENAFNYNTATSGRRF